MNYKKTFWMNAVLAVLFLCITLSIFYIGSASEIIMASEAYTTLFGFSFLYMLAIAPLLTSISAYSISKCKYVNHALLLNIFQLMFVFVVVIYAYSMPMSMNKKMMQPEAIVFFFIYAIPSLINLRVLKKMENK